MEAAPPMSTASTASTASVASVAATVERAPRVGEPPGPYDQLRRLAIGEARVLPLSTCERKALHGRARRLGIKITYHAEDGGVRVRRIA
jgi:hypothetical protein